MSKLTQKKIRAYAGVKRNTQLPALLEGRPTVDQSLGVFGERYNNEIKQKRKQKHNEAQAKYVKRKKAIEKLKKLKIVEKIRDLLKAKKNSVFYILTEDDYKNEIPPISQVQKIFSKLKGKSVHTQLIDVDDKTINFEQTFDIPTENFNSWWGREKLVFGINSSLTIFDDYPNTKFFIFQPNKLTEKLIKQEFREGIKNCMLSPIREWAEAKMEEAETKQTKSRYNCILKDLTIFEEQYKDGVPEDAIAEICNKLQIDISVEMPFCENNFIEGQSIKKRLKSFKYVNTRINHVDLNEVVKVDDFEEVSRSQLKEIKEQLDTNNEYYTYKKSMNQVSSISTLTKNYRINDDFNKIITEFEESTGLIMCKVDDVDDADLTKFISEGTNYNGTVDFHEPSDDIKHIDMEKAYTKSSTCKQYEGFLAKITDFRQTDKIEGVGMYRITDLNMEGADLKFKRYNDKMKIYLTNNVYTSPELKMLIKRGATFKVVSGCWGVAPIKFEFGEEMMKKTEFGASYYAKWSGICDSHQLEKSFWMKCSELHFNAIRANCGCDVALRYENGEALFKYKKKHNYHLAHITAFLTAYQRLNTLEQLMNMEYENIYRVCVDGIYFKGETELVNVFRIKDEIKLGNEAGASYVSQACRKELRNRDGSPREMHLSRKHYEKELHLGEGGCGKTHMNCNDGGLIRHLFVAPSWKLAVSKKRETGINATVWARALSTDPEKIRAIRERANVLIVDEVSMLTEHQKKRFFELYGDMKIIMCGDLGYQLPCIDGEEMKPTGFDNIVKHTTDYRCRDARLKEIKNELRKMIEYDRPRDEINTWVVGEFKRLGRVISIDELQNKYDVKDMILSGTNAIKDTYTKMFEGKFSKEKYYVMENNRLYQNGEILIGAKPEKTLCEVRHCFTTHSIQGETAEFNLFIDTARMFEARMFYTAISRARTLDQIFMVENTPEFKFANAKIYKIESKSGVYIGSTIGSLEKRFTEHKRNYEQYQKGKGKYITSFKLLGDEAKISLVEECPCNDMRQLWGREKEIIQSVECVNKTFAEGK